jgi:hypothetical protein
VIVGVRPLGDGAGRGFHRESPCRRGARGLRPGRVRG